MFNMPYGWGQFRDSSGTIDLLSVYASLWGPLPPKAEEYLGAIQGMQPIRSRQAATVALYTANALFGSE